MHEITRAIDHHSNDRPREKTPGWWRCKWGFLHIAGEKKPICPHCFVPKPKKQSNDSRGRSMLVLRAFADGATSYDNVRDWIQVNAGCTIMHTAIRTCLATLTVRGAMVRRDKGVFELTELGREWIANPPPKRKHRCQN